MKLPIKILLESLKGKPWCYGSQLKLDPQLYDMLVQEVKSSNIVRSGGTGCWISRDQHKGRPIYLWAYGTRITPKDRT